VADLGVCSGLWTYVIFTLIFQKNLSFSENTLLHFYNFTKLKKNPTKIWRANPPLSRGMVNQSSINLGNTTVHCFSRRWMIWKISDRCFCPLKLKLVNINVQSLVGSFQRKKKILQNVKYSVLFQQFCRYTVFYVDASIEH
jgi:hypothetical protein